MYMSLVRDVRKNRAVYVNRLVAWEECGGGGGGVGALFYRVVRKFSFIRSYLGRVVKTVRGQGLQRTEGPTI